MSGTRAGNYQIPFDSKGNQLHYAGYGDITWQDNFDFAGPITILQMARGRSAAYFVIEMTAFVAPDPLAVDSGYVQGIMFMTDLFDALKRSGCMPGGIIPGIFTFVKRGQNYGVKLV